MNKKIIVIGISGGSSSGKTAFSEKIFEKLGQRGLLISQDSFYHSLNDYDRNHVDEYNFDSPSAINFEELYRVITQIKEKPNLINIVKIPKYDFKTHTKIKDKYVDCSDVKILIVEGIFIFYYEKIRKLFDFSIFVDTDPDIRLIRRLERDVEKRGRTIKMVIERYKKFVRPSHIKFVEPTKRYANIIVPTGVDNFFSLEILIDMFKI